MEIQNEINKGMGSQKLLVGFNCPRSLRLDDMDLAAATVITNGVATPAVAIPPTVIEAASRNLRLLRSAT